MCTRACTHNRSATMSNFTAVRDHALFTKDMQSMLSGDLPVLTFNTENNFELLDSNSSIVGVLDGKLVFIYISKSIFYRFRLLADSSKFDFTNYCVSSSDVGGSVDTANADTIAAAIVSTMTSSLPINVEQQQVLLNASPMITTTSLTTATTTTTSTFARQYAELAKNLEHSIGNFEDILTSNYTESSLSTTTDSITEPNRRPSSSTRSNEEVLYNDLHLSSCDEDDDDDDDANDEVCDNDAVSVAVSDGEVAENNVETTDDDGDKDNSNDDNDNDVDDVENVTDNVFPEAAVEKLNTDDSDTDADSDYVAGDVDPTDRRVVESLSYESDATAADADDDDEDDDDLENRKILIQQQVRAVKRQLNCAKRKREHNRVRRSSNCTSGGSSSSSSGNNNTFSTGFNVAKDSLPNIWVSLLLCFLHNK